MFVEFSKDLEKKKEKKNMQLIEKRIYEVDKIIKRELDRGIKLGDIDLEDLAKVTIQRLANLVFYIISKDKLYLKEYINLVKYFLNKYTKYKLFEGDKELFLKKLTMSIHPEKFQKDTIIMHKGDIGDKFYIIFRGSVSIIIVQERYINLTEEEYSNYLKKLHINKEYSLIRLVFTYPNLIKADQDILKDIHNDLQDLSDISSKQNLFINNNDNEKISAKEYVERIEPEIDENSSYERTKVKIATYKIVANLKEGDTFGEIALSKIDKEERRRTATVITDTDCLMGSILNNVYSRFLKEIEDKNKLIIIGQLLQHTLFRDVAPENFLKYNYFNFFNNVTYKGGDFLFKQGDSRNEIYFINDGLVDISTHSSLEEINNYMNCFRNDINKFMKRYHTINNNKNNENFLYEENYRKNHSLPGFDKYFKTKRNIKIYSINKKETLGYNDCLFKEGKYFISAKVISDTCQVFVLRINFLITLLKDRLLSKNYSLTNFERKKIMIQRLRDLNKSILDKFLENNRILFSFLFSINSNKKNKGNNAFKHSTTKINLFLNKNKNLAINEKNIFSLKIKRKMNSKKLKINPVQKKNITWEHFSFDKTDKINNLIIENNKKNKENEKKLIDMINNTINSNNSNEFLSLPTFKSKSFTKNKSHINSYKNEEKKNFSNKLNKLIPKVSFLSKKLMINEYSINKNKNKLNSINMTQLDFLLNDYFFTERGNKNYSKDPIFSDI